MIVFLIAAVILHLSLFPWQFHAVALERSPLWILMHSWPVMSSRRTYADITANLLLYVPLGVSLYLAMARRWPRPAAIAGSTVAAFLLSAAIETLQIYSVSRKCNTADLLANLGGAAAGAGLAALTYRAGLPGALDTRFRWRSSPAVLLYCWAAYQLYPFMVDTQRHVLSKKLAQLAQGFAISPVALMAGAADWVAVGLLVRSAAGTRWALLCYTALALLTPLEIMIHTRSVTWSELAAVPVGFALWRALARLGFQRQTIAGAALLVTGIVIGGLAPFQRTLEPVMFQWTPFQPVIGYRSTIIATMFRKVFRYGAVLWLARTAGFRLSTAACLLLPLLAGIEAAQIFLAGHVPESTDPLLAGMIALALFALDRFGRQSGESSQASFVERS